MTEIDVPDWVVAVALDAYKASRGTYEGEVPVDADDMHAALTAALGAWAVPTGTITRRAFDRFMSSSHGSQAMFHLYAAYDDDVTLYTLRQEKPE